MRVKVLLLLASALLACGLLQGQSTTFTMTVNSNPQGRTFTADSGPQHYTAPQVLNWNAGSVHYIQWDTPQVIGTVQYAFIGWADGPGDNPRIIVMPGVNTILTGNFNTSGTPNTNLKYVPISPCRLTDTRPYMTPPGGFGPPALAAGETRTYPIPQGRCGIPATAAAYALNVTVVPSGPLGYLSLWPTGQVQPLVSTLNSADGGIVANAAIVPAGTQGAVSVYVTDPTDLVMDINGYFDPTAGITSYAFYTLTPCRLVDTRLASGTFGGPSLAGGFSRDFPLASGPCSLPLIPNAYSLNATVVPYNVLGYLSLWPTGQALPYTSTLNSLAGRVLANAALVVAGSNGGVSAYVTDPTDLILDVNGYFAPSGNANNLVFNPLPPCRVLDTRNATGTFGGPVMAGNSTRSVPVVSGSCGVPSTAKAYSFNVTVVPQEPLGYLSIWPTGSTRPTVSTLNSLDGRIVANAAIVPADADGSINVYVTNVTHVILDVNGYFAAPPQ